jgi:hypothetical protein
VLELGFRYRLKPLRLLALVSAGFVPFVSFVAERKTTAHIRALPTATTPVAPVAVER